MTTVVLPRLSQVGTNEWDDVEANDKALRDVINGGLDNTNLSASAGISHSKLANSTAGNLLIANASGVITGTAVTGDVTINSSGVTAIGSSKVTNAMMADDSVGSAELIADSVGSSEIAANAVGAGEIGSLPTVSVTKGSTQSIADSTDVALTWSTELWDTDGMHSTVTNTDRLTAVTAGVYLVTLTVTWANDASGTGRREIWIQQAAGTDVAASQVPNFGANPTNHMVASGLFKISAGDYVQAFVWQNSGGALNVNTSGTPGNNGNVSTNFAAHWLGDG